MVSKKTAIIIGSSGEIGSFISQKLAYNNVRVILASRNYEVNSRIVSEIKNKGGEGYPYKLDVTIPEDVFSFIDDVGAKHGQVHFLIYSSGTGLPKPLSDTSVEYLDNVVDVNFKGFFLAVQRIIPLMKKNNFGRIVGFASPAGKKGLGFASAYSASKAALINFCQSVSLEIAHHNITINSICPKGLQTSFSKKAWTMLATYKGLTYEELLKNKLDEVGIRRRLDLEDLWPVLDMLLFRSSNALTGQSINICGSYEVR